MLMIGPFFYINKKLIFNACTLDQARPQADKLDNSYGHDQLYEDYYKDGDYIDYPRGRVDYTGKGKPIIYMSPHIDDSHIPGIVKTFELIEYPIIKYDHSKHYQCYLDKEK